MIYKMYAIYDKHTGYMAPTGYHNDEVAKRAFALDITSPEMKMIQANPEDFQLEHIGHYNTETGELKEHKAEIIITASEILRKE